MKLSELVLTHTTGKGPLDWVYFAEVSVTTETGILWWKKTHATRRKIIRKYAECWAFIDTGEYCPELQAENLERSYKAKELLAGLTKT
jgi:hypothetical protein